MVNQDRYPRYDGSIRPVDELPIRNTTAFVDALLQYLTRQFNDKFQVPITDEVKKIFDSVIRQTLTKSRIKIHLDSSEEAVILFLDDLSANLGGAFATLKELERFSKKRLFHTDPAPSRQSFLSGIRLHGTKSRLVAELTQTLHRETEPQNSSISTPMLPISPYIAEQVMSEPPSQVSFVEVSDIIPDRPEINDFSSDAIAQTPDLIDREKVAESQKLQVPAQEGLKKWEVQQPLIVHRLGSAVYGKVKGDFSLGIPDWVGNIYRGGLYNDRIGSIAQLNTHPLHLWDPVRKNS